MLGVSSSQAGHGMNTDLCPGGKANAIVWTVSAVGKVGTAGWGGHRGWSVSRQVAIPVRSSQLGMCCPAAPLGPLMGTGTGSSSWDASQGGDPSPKGVGDHTLCKNTLLPTSHGCAPAPKGIGVAVISQVHRSHSRDFLLTCASFCLEMMVLFKQTALSHPLQERTQGSSWCCPGSAQHSQAVSNLM